MNNNYIRIILNIKIDRKRKMYLLVMFKRKHTTSVLGGKKGKIVQENAIFLIGNYFLSKIF